MVDVVECLQLKYHPTHAEIWLALLLKQLQNLGNLLFLVETLQVDSSLHEKSLTPDRLFDFCRNVLSLLSGALLPLLDRDCFLTKDFIVANVSDVVSVFAKKCGLDFANRLAVVSTLDYSQRSVLAKSWRKVVMFRIDSYDHRPFHSSLLK
jgi:hypothetical protein